MVTDNHYRWDFIQLSTDVKPTPATSKKVTDGSTLYTSDDSKLYVWYKDQWYEKEAPGGGSSYTAGDGIDISDNTISVDTNTIQEKLTAGTNITIDNNVISAAGGAILLTEQDYDYPADNPTSIEIMNLAPGIYQIASNSSIRYKLGTFIDNTRYATFIVGYINGYFDNNKWVILVDSIGVRIAKSSLSSTQVLLDSRNIVNNLTSTSVENVLSAAQGKALNDKIGGDLSNLTTTDKTSLINAINEVAGQITPTTDSSAPTTATVGRLGQIQIDTTTNTAYMCVAVDDVTPSYSWKQITA